MVNPGAMQSSTAVSLYTCLRGKMRKMDDAEGCWEPTCVCVCVDCGSPLGSSPSLPVDTGRYTPNSNATSIHQRAHIGTAIAASLITTPKWKQPECPSLLGQMKKVRYIHTMEYYTVRRKNQPHL